MKKIILAILGVIMIGAGSLMATQPTYAACDGGSFLGFKPWYDGLPCDSNGAIMAPSGSQSDESGATLAAFIWGIVLNVLFDLSLAVGYIAVAMVIYGGYLYIISQGDPTRLAKAKKTLVTAVAGTVIALGATVIVNTLTYVLGIRNGQPGEFNADTLHGVFNWAYGMAGIVAVVFIIKSGFNYMVAAGNAQKLQQATKGLVFSVVGLVIVILAAAITNFVITQIGGAL